MTWERFKDTDIINIWIKNPKDNCEEEIGEVEINPDWYEANGTPICICGEDLVYSHTLVNTNKLLIYRN